MKTEALDLSYTLHHHTGKFSRYEICRLHFRHQFLFPDERQAKIKKKTTNQKNPQNKQVGQYCTYTAKLFTFKIKQVA